MADDPPTLADAKAALAAAGVDVRPDAKFDVLPVNRDKPNTFIVLDRTKPGHVPDYCVHGFTQCLICQHPCYLGSESVKVVKDGTLPLCKDCATEHVQVEAQDGHVPIKFAHVSDHLRADGPHDE